MLQTLLIVLVILLLAGALPYGSGPYLGTGWYGGGGIGFVLLVVVLVLLLR